MMGEGTAPPEAPIRGAGAPEAARQDAEADPVRLALEAARDAWERTQDPKHLRRVLLDVLRDLEERS